MGGDGGVEVRGYGIRFPFHLSLCCVRIMSPHEPGVGYKETSWGASYSHPHSFQTPMLHHSNSTNPPSGVVRERTPGTHTPTRVVTKVKRTA
jgi:hypothetical protein